MIKVMQSLYGYEIWYDDKFVDVYADYSEARMRADAMCPVKRAERMAGV